MSSATHPEGATPLVQELMSRGEREPLDVDISDYSDEFCAGFLAGQVNALQALVTRGCRYGLGESFAPTKGGAQTRLQAAEDGEATEADGERGD